MGNNSLFFVKDAGPANARALSDARFPGGVEAGRDVGARLIKPFERGRSRWQRTRALCKFNGGKERRAILLSEQLSTTHRMPAMQDGTLTASPSIKCMIHNALDTHEFNCFDSLIIYKHNYSLAARMMSGTYFVAR